MRFARARSSLARYPWMWGLLALAYLPLLSTYFQDLWIREHYRFAPFFLAAVLGIIWKRWQDAPPVERAMPVRSLVILFSIALTLLAAASLLQSPALAFLSALVSAGGALIIATRKRALANALGLWCLLCIGFRLPFQLDLQLILGFQTITTEISSRVLDAFHMMHLTDGHVLSLPNKDFFIDEACSGIMSFMALFAAGALLAVLQKCSLVHSLALIAATCIWALLMNSVRIVVIAAVFLHRGTDLSSGLPHEILGLMTFAAAIFGILSSNHLLRYLLAPISYRRSASYQIRPSKERVSEASDTPPKAILPWRKGLCAALILLLGFQLTLSALDQNTETTPTTFLSLPKLPHEHFEDASIRPANPTWKLVGFDHVNRHRRSIWGEHSLIWTFQHEETTIRFALDYPFNEHHDLRICYAGRGWQSLHRKVLDDGERGAAEIDLHKPSTNEHACSISGLIDASGQWNPWPEDTLSKRVAARLQRSNTPTTSQARYQLQAFVVSGHRLGVFQRADLRSAFQDFKKQIATHFKEMNEPTSAAK